jgi:hypothetical protein
VDAEQASVVDRDEQLQETVLLTSRRARASRSRAMPTS